MVADLSGVAPKSLARLMGLGNDPQHWGWGRHELADVLRHQLHAPLLFDVNATAGAADEGGPVGCLDDLFRHPRPPLPLLRLTKDFAKVADQPPDGAVPAEVATVLYYAAIVAAFLRHGERISRLSDEQLSQGVAWGLGQPWLDETLAGLFKEAAWRLREAKGQ